MAGYKLMSYHGHIYVKYTHQNQRFIISTRFPSEELWDPMAKNLNPRHMDYASARRVTDGITDQMITAARRVITAGFEPTVHLVRQEYYKVLESAEPEKPEERKYPEFYKMWDEFIKLKEAEMRYDGFRNYTQLHALLREFEQYDHYEMDFHTFDAVMFGRLKQFMFLVKEYQDATTLKHVNKLRTFFKWAVPGLDRSFIKFKPFLPENINTLTPGELHYLADYEFALKGYLDKTRDLFLFCAMTGMRYSDSQRFDRAWIKDGLIEYSQRKTAKNAVIPMLDTANKILVKWGYDTPKITNAAYNRHLKDLFQELEIDRMVPIQESNGGKMEVKHVPFWEQVSSHTARKTFVTYAIQQGIPIPDVMRMSGHSNFEMMRPYVSVSREQIKAAAKKLEL